MQTDKAMTRMFRVKDVAQLLDVHVSTVYRLAESGRLQSVRVGFGKGALRIPAEGLNAYLLSVGLAPVTGDADAEAVA